MTGPAEALELIFTLIVLRRNENAASVPSAKPDGVSQRGAWATFGDELAVRGAATVGAPQLLKPGSEMPNVNTEPNRTPSAAEY